MDSRMSCCRVEVEVEVEVEVVLPPSCSRGDGVTFTTNLSPAAEAANNYNSLDNSPPIATTITADAADVTAVTATAAATASDAPAPTARYQSITR